jgi:hypothetical protein
VLRYVGKNNHSDGLEIWNSLCMSFIIWLFSTFSAGEEEYTTVLCINHYSLSYWNLGINAEFHLCTYTGPPTSSKSKWKRLYVSAFAVELNREWRNLCNNLHYLYPFCNVKIIKLRCSNGLDMLKMWETDMQTKVLVCRLRQKGPR